MVNWHGAIESDTICLYKQAIALVVKPLLDVKDQSVRELNDEIVFVCQTMKLAALNHLPKIKQKRSRSHMKIVSPELKTLCCVSKKAWKIWNSNGRPTSGPLYDNKMKAKRDVHVFITKHRAKVEHMTIQRRDTLFKNNDRNRFKSYKPPLKCNKISTSDGISTDNDVIINEFCRHFSSLATSRVDPSQHTSQMNSMLNESFGKS